MTSETRTLVEANDITGIEIECPECHLMIFYPVFVKEVIKIGHNCPHCNQAFFDATRNNVHPGFHYPAIEAIQGIAANLRALTRTDRTDIHATIRFRINAEKKSAA